MKQGRVDEYMAEATPEQKMARTKSEQSGGWDSRRCIARLSGHLT